MIQDLAKAVLSKEGYDLVTGAKDVIGEDRNVEAYVMYPTSLEGKLPANNTLIMLKD